MLRFFKKKKIVVEDKKVIPQEDYSDIEIIANYFQKETGVTFDSQMRILENKVNLFCKQRKIYSYTQLLVDIQSDKALKQELIDRLTTNETYFYREFKQIQELVELVKKSHGKVTILCAPSATGEEPYSIAIALLEAGISYSTFKIVGIDINADAITKAKEAVFWERNIRNLSPQIISKYFKQKDKDFALNQNIKSLVSFQIANIFDDSFTNLGKFDFIFSRNMLIYFDKETKLKAKTILENMRKESKYPVFFGHADLF